MRTWYNRWLPRYNFSYGYRQVFRFLLLGQWFSLQSWCVQWSIESAEGSVLPLSDGQEVDSGWVYIGSTKTAD